MQISPPHFTRSAPIPDGYFDGAIKSICDIQSDNGAIPWFENGVYDPWNHLEAAMGLNICGAYDAADKAYHHLFKTQLEDGSWWGQLGSAVPIDDTLHSFSRTSMDTGQLIRDTNFIAYCATACWHHWLIRGDIDFLKTAYRVVDKAIAFILPYQSEHGEFRWTADDPDTPENDALLTGNSSIHKSLGCAILIAETLGHERPDWLLAQTRLSQALTDKPERFDRTWVSKERFSMDWYYPALSGALSKESARARLEEKWDIFVIPNVGVRCVSDEPWVTTAESAELILALCANDEMTRAEEHLQWLHQFRDERGAYWMGLQVEQNVFWPIECPPWTAGAVILATDAVCQLTKGSELFTPAN